jgi:hypothetical protein
MGAYQVLKQSFEQRIAVFNKQIQDETEGEYSVEPLPSGYVQLSYKGAVLIELLAQGLTYKQLYQQIVTLVKAFIFHELVDFAASKEWTL